MLEVLMSENNQLYFFDEDYGTPQFKKHKPFPMPIKVEVGTFDNS
jgi:hypothetical protein